MTFLIDWYYTTKEVLVTKNYFPSVGNIGESMIQVVASGPDSDWEDIHYAYFLQYVKLEKCLYRNSIFHSR